jgi:hypothetical protein
VLELDELEPLPVLDELEPLPVLDELEPLLVLELDELEPLPVLELDELELLLSPLDPGSGFAVEPVPASVDSPGSPVVGAPVSVSDEFAPVWLLEAPLVPVPVASVSAGVTTSTGHASEEAPRRETMTR